MSFFGQQMPQQGAPQGNPSSMFGGQIPPQILQMLMQRMQQQQGGQQPPQPQMPPPQTMPPPQMPPNGMNPVNVPQTPPMGGQAPMQGGPMNPLASVLGNGGGAMGPQGQLNNGSAGGGNGMGGLSQIINSLKSAQSVNGTQPQGAPGGMDIMALIKAMQQSGGGM